MSAAARQPLLEVDALEVELGGGGIGATPPARVLTGVDLSLQAGEIVGLIGETGSGKTTLARTIVGLHEPAAGEVRFDGEPISRLGRRARREFRRRGDIQFVFQSPLRSLDPDMRIGEIVAEGLTIGRRPARADLERRVAAALTKVGLDPALMSRRPATISGGQRQRVAIARAIATDPRLIVFDEPVSALDASSRNYILKVLLELRESLGIAILVISHDMSSITEVADRVLVLYHGSLVEDGPLPGTFEQPQHPYTALLIASTPAAVRRDGRYDVPPAAALRLPVGSDVVPENGCPYAPRCPFATEICRAVAPDRTEPRPAQTVRCHHAPTWRAHTERAPSAV